jgi:hypothetical protein
MNTDKNGDKANLRTRYGKLSLPNKVITGLLAVAAAFTTLWGAFQAIEGALGMWRNWTDKGTELVRTPRLGLEFWQNGVRNDMFFNDNGNKEIVRVAMQSEPFELRFPKLEEDLCSPPGCNVALQMTAGSDDSNFSVREGTKIGYIDLEKHPEDIKYLDSPFLHGKSAAAYQFGSGKLYLITDAHMSFSGTQIASHSSSQDKIFFTTVQPPEGAPHPLAKQKDDIFLTVVFDRDADEVIEFGEYEYVVLDF